MEETVSVKRAQLTKWVNYLTTFPYKDVFEIITDMVEALEASTVDLELPEDTEEDAPISDN